MTHQVVVTGAGIVSPLGIELAEFQRRMFMGDSGIVDVRGHWVSPSFPVPFAGLVPRDRLDERAILHDTEGRSWDSFSRFAAAATEEALASLPVDAPIDAIVYGSGEGVGFDLATESFRRFPDERFPWESTRSEPALGTLNRLLERTGRKPVAGDRLITLNAACASGNQAIGLAFQRIRCGQWARALVGAVDARCNDSNLLNFHLLGALTTADRPAREASRPFSLDRSGFVRAEGAATLVLESAEAAAGRGAVVMGAVAGYACTTDAYRLTDERPDGLSVRRAIELALRDAGVSPEEVSAISAHGTSTVMNDRLETAAIKQVFGPSAYGIPVTSLKSQLGHAGIAAGVFEAVASLLMLREQRLAPTINYGPPDPECDLDYVPNESRPARLEVMLSNNFGFGGQNTCLVLTRRA